MTPEQLCKSNTEHSHQVAFFSYMAIARLHGWEIADVWAATGQAFPWDGVTLRLPELTWLHAVPNGGSRGDTKASAQIRGQNLKAEGVRSGIADVFLPVPRKRSKLSDEFVYCGLYIEFKAPKLKPKTDREGTKGGLSEEQQEFKLYALSNGYGWAVCYSWREAVVMVRSYLNWQV